LHIPEATIISCYYKSQFRDVLMITVWCSVSASLPENAFN
jgi:hypothetical protein